MPLSFPRTSPFPELMGLAVRKPGKIVLWDHSSGVRATAGQLLHSVSLLRAKVQAAILHHGMYEGRKEGDDQFVFLIAPPGWEYVVAMLAIFALGSGMSAQCKQLSFAETTFQRGNSC